jgi:hypothetical protein
MQPRPPTVVPPTTRARAITAAPPTVAAKRRPTRRRPPAHPRMIKARPWRMAVEVSGSVPTRRLLAVRRALAPGPSPRIVTTGSARAAAATVIDRTGGTESLVTTIGTAMTTGDIHATIHPTSVIVIITTGTITAADHAPLAPRVPRAMPLIPSPRSSGPSSYRSWS